MKKYILYIILMSLTTFSFAQTLATPKVDGIPTGITISEKFPFHIKGIPFKYFDTNVWNPKSVVVAELQITYYMEGDTKLYTNKTIKKVNLGEGGSWSFANLSVEPLPYAIQGKQMVEGKTNYGLFIYQEYLNQRSGLWNVKINRIYSTIESHKIPDQNKGPKVILPKDKIILNPQPIPPKEIKKKLKGNL